MANSARLQAICAQQHKHLMAVASSAFASGLSFESDPFPGDASGLSLESDPFVGDDLELLGEGDCAAFDQESHWLLRLSEAADDLNKCEHEYVNKMMP